MKSLFRLLPLLAMCLLTACHTDGFTLEGHLDGGEGKTLWVSELTPEGEVFVDSIPINGKGNFHYRGTMPYRTFYNLHTSENNFVVTLPDRGEKVRINGRYDNLSLSYSVVGSKESVLLWQLQRYSDDGVVELERLIDTTEHYAQLLFDGVIDQQAVLDKKDETDSIYHLLFADQHDYVCRFIDDNQGSLTTLIALFKTFNNRLLIDTRDLLSLDYYQMVLSGLEERYPDNPHTLHFKNSVEHLRNSLAQSYQ